MKNRFQYYKGIMMGINLMLRKKALFTLLSLIVLSGFGCSKDDVAPAPDPVVVVEETPKQYDVPFNGVPDATDVAMYEVNLRAFSSAGNLKGVEEKLDHIKSLGINIMWLMPIHPIGQVKGVGSPYAVKDYLKINSAFGTLEDLRSVVKAAHARNMAVMMDWVANHTSWDHPWIQNATWYARDNGGNIISPPGMGWNDVAELNYSSQSMRKEMIKAMKYWVLEANIDGYRCDYAEGVPDDFWKQAIDTLRNIPNRKIIMFAEAGKKELLNAGFDLTFGWNFYSKIKDVYNTNAAATTVYTAHVTDYQNVAPGKHILRWIDNHDDNAWHSTPLTVFKGKEGKLAAFVVTAYLGGATLLYNGQEVAHPVQLGFFEGTNTKIDWSKNADVLDEYKKIMTLKQNNEALRQGSLENFSSSDVVAFRRKTSEHDVWVLVNVRNTEREFQLPEALVDTDWKDAYTNQSTSLSSSISLSAYAYRVLVK